MTTISRCILFLFLFNYIFETIECQEIPNVFLTAAKSVPRIGRSNKANSEFEKFFLKASKSVPRIGRRNENPYLQYEGTDKDLTGSKNKYPTWSEIAERYEYDPELFSQDFLPLFEEEMGDDPNVYEWDKVRLKRRTPTRIVPNNKHVYKI